MMQRKFTGWHMLAMMVAFFGVVIAVNLTMARIAIGSFGGVLVENSYVASQEFNGWLAEVRAQEALGWDVKRQLQPDRRLLVSVTGAPDMLTITGTARPPLGKATNLDLTFTRIAPGEYLSAVPIPAGRMTVRLHVASGADNWRSEDNLQ